jgi:hypothetical protein
VPSNDSHYSGEGKLIEAVILGDPNKTVIPVVCDNLGRLYVDAVISGGSGAIVQIEDTAGNPLTSVSGSLNVNVTDFPTSTVVTQGTTPWVVSGNISIGPEATGINIFADNDSVTNGVETTILPYTNTGISWITQIVAWGTYDGEFLIRKNGAIVGGGRTSAADRTLNILYNNPIPTITGDVILVTILEHGPGLQQFRCNFMGE